MQASFIPKKPLTSMGVSAQSHSVGVVWFISVLLFIISLAGAGSVYMYQQYLAGSIGADKTQLTQAQAAYDPAVISSIIRLDDRIAQAKSLLQRHTAPSAIFDFLGNTTVPGVRFTAFTYTTNIDGTGSLLLSGEALDFASVALLSDAFNASHSLKDTLFSDINVDPASGHIVFKVAATVDPSLVAYKNAMNSSAAAAGNNVPASPAAPTLPASSTPAQ